MGAKFDGLSSVGCLRQTAELKMVRFGYTKINVDHESGWGQQGLGPS